MKNKYLHKIKTLLTNKHNNQNNQNNQNNLTNKNTNEKPVHNLKSNIYPTELVLKYKRFAERSKRKLWYSSWMERIGVGIFAIGLFLSAKIILLFSMVLGESFHKMQWDPFHRIEHNNIEKIGLMVILIGLSMFATSGCIKYLIQNKLKKINKQYPINNPFTNIHITSYIQNSQHNINKTILLIEESSKKLLKDALTKSEQAVKADQNTGGIECKAKSDENEIGIQNRALKAELYLNDRTPFISLLKKTKEIINQQTQLKLIMNLTRKLTWSSLKKEIYTSLIWLFISIAIIFAFMFSDNYQLIWFLPFLSSTIMAHVFIISLEKEKRKYERLENILANKITKQAINQIEKTPEYQKLHHKQKNEFDQYIIGTIVKQISLSDANLAIAKLINLIILNISCNRLNSHKKEEIFESHIQTNIIGRIKEDIRNINIEI